MEAVDKNHKQYYPDEIDMLKDAVGISGILMMYVLNELLKMKQPGEPLLSAPGQPCYHKCTECKVNLKSSCEKCKKVRNYCMQCTKRKPHNLLKTGMVSGLSIIS